MIISLDSLGQRLWIMGVLVLWAGLLFGGFLFGRYEPLSGRRMPRWTRLASSAILVTLGWSWTIFLVNSSLIGPALIPIALGMSLGFVGDLALAQVFGGKQSFLIGIGAFALGHISYITGMVWLAHLLHLTSGGAFAVGLGLWMLVGVLGWFVVAAGAGQLGNLALPYSLLLCGTAAIATALAIQSVFFVPVAFGAGLFVISDLLIAAERFRDLRFPLLDDVVWLTYGPAQVLIVCVAEFGLRFLSH